MSTLSNILIDTPNKTYDYLLGLLNEWEENEKKGITNTINTRSVFNATPIDANTQLTLDLERNQTITSTLNKAKEQEAALSITQLPIQQRNANVLPPPKLEALSPVVMQQQLQQQQELLYKRTQNKNEYPICVRNNNATIKQYTDKTIGTFYYLEGDPNLYKNIGFSIDNSYFNFETGGGGKYECVKDGKPKIINGKSIQYYKVQFNVGNAEIGRVVLKNLESTNSPALIDERKNPAELAKSLNDQFKQYKGVITQKQIQTATKNKERFKSEYLSNREIAKITFLKSKVQKTLDVKSLYDLTNQERNNLEARKKIQKDYFDLIEYRWTQSSIYYINIATKTIEILQLVVTILGVVFPAAAAFTRVVDTVLGVIKEALEAYKLYAEGASGIGGLVLNVVGFVLLPEIPAIKKALKVLKVESKLAKRILSPTTGEIIIKEIDHFVNVLGTKIYTKNMQANLLTVTEKLIKKTTGSGELRDNIKAYFTEEEAEFLTIINNIDKSTVNSQISQIKKETVNNTIKRIYVAGKNPLGLKTLQTSA